MKVEVNAMKRKKDKTVRYTDFRRKSDKEAMSAWDAELRKQSYDINVYEEIKSIEFLGIEKFNDKFSSLKGMKYFEEFRTDMLNAASEYLLNKNLLSLYTEDISSLFDKDFKYDESVLKYIESIGPVSLEFSSMAERGNISHMRVVLTKHMSEKDTTVFACTIDYAELDGFGHMSPLFLFQDEEYIYMHDVNGVNPRTVIVNGNEIPVRKKNKSKFFDIQAEVKDNGTVIFSSAHALLSLISAVKKYQRTLNSVKTIKRTSTARNRVDKVNTAGVQVVERLNINNVAHDVFTPLSDLAVRTVYEKKEWQGGHHASPIPHDVSGHYRTYKNGKRVWVNGYHKQCLNHIDTGEKPCKVIVVDK